MKIVHISMADFNGADSVLIVSVRRKELWEWIAEW